MKKKITSLFLLITLVASAIMLGGSKSSGNKPKNKMDFEFRYELRIDNIPGASNSIDIWIPLPTESKYQTVDNYEIKSKLPYGIYIEPEFGNRILHFSSIETIPKEIEIYLELSLTRFEQDGWSQPTNSEGIAAAEFEKYTTADELVPVDGQIATEAQQVTDNSMTTVQKIEALYQHLFETMEYDKSGEGWGNGDAIYACDSRKGNCTDIHSLFIGMARSLGIPSRFIIGFPLSEKYDAMVVAGYHCWAEFYLDDHGWVPVDISEAIKNPEKKNYLFGNLDNNRVAFTTGRDIKLDSTHSLNYFIYPYVLIDEKAFETFSYNFSYKKL